MQAAPAAGCPAIRVGDARPPDGVAALQGRGVFPDLPVEAASDPTARARAPRNDRLAIMVAPDAAEPCPRRRRDQAPDGTGAGKKKKDRAVANEKSQNVQDVFLNHVRKNKTPVTVFLVNGVKLQGIITWFDNFSVLLRRDGHTQLVYKHAISTVMPGSPIQLFDGVKESSGSTLTLPQRETVSARSD
jgi:host factor-I protein